MKSKIVSGLLVVVFTGIFLSGCTAMARHHKAFAHDLVSQKTAADPISGAWNVSFIVKGHPVTPATFNLKLDGEKVTGTAYSDHTGEGAVRDGKYSDGKLSFTLEFKKHESIAITGNVTDGKLSGEFTTEGFTSTWEGVKK
jgi:uncharacterized protein (DUF2147 family)